MCVCTLHVFHSLCSQDHLLARAGFFRLTVLPRQMFAHCLTGKLCLTGVAKVPRQVERLTWKKTKEGKKTDETTIKLYYEINVVQYKLKMTKKKNVQESYLPSTREVSSVTLAAFLRPAGRLSPKRSNFSRRHRPPFLDFALETYSKELCITYPTKSSNWIIQDPKRLNIWSTAAGAEAASISQSFFIELRYNQINVNSLFYWKGCA